MRRDEHLRIDPGNLDMSGVGDIHGKNSFRSSEGIRVELRAFVALSHNIDDPEETHGFTMDHSLHRHKIVELQEAAFTHSNPELERPGIL